MFGVDCRSMDTFSDGNTYLAMSTMFLPEPVMRLAVKQKKKTIMRNAFGRAIAKFTNKYPTFGSNCVDEAVRRLPMHEDYFPRDWHR
jgi:elongation factor G